MTTRPTFNTTAVDGSDADGRLFDAREGSEAAFGAGNPATGGSDYRSPWARPDGSVPSRAESGGPGGALPAGPPPPARPAYAGHAGYPTGPATGGLPVGPATGGVPAAFRAEDTQNPPTGPGGTGGGWGQPPASPWATGPAQGWAAPQYPPPGGPHSGGPGGTGGPGGPSGPGGPYTSAAQPGPLGSRRKLLAAALALVLVSGGVGGGIGALVADGNHSTQVVSTSGLTRSTDTNPVAPAADDTVSKAAQVILPSVVTISEVGNNEAGTGSGVIIRADGYILTNNHVVSGASGAAGSLTVTLQSGDTVGATVVGTDPSSDLAVIKINKTGLTAATFGDSDALQIGELVVAVGSPLGLSGTVTSGIVSAVHRPVRTGDSQVRDANAVLDAIQTDAPINPGNSGGPLVNSKGQIVGINSAIATVDGGGSPFGGGQQQQSGNIGVGFAIASNYAQKIAQQLITSQKAVHPYLGINAQDSGNDPTGTGIGGDGAQIRSLVAGGPAQLAGLQNGDVITKIDDRAVSDVDALIAAVRAHEIGEKVTVTYTRDGQTQTAQVTLAQQPSS